MTNAVLPASRKLTGAQHWQIRWYPPPQHAPARRARITISYSRQAAGAGKARRA